MRRANKDKRVLVGEGTDRFGVMRRDEQLPYALATQLPHSGHELINLREGEMVVWLIPEAENGTDLIVNREDKSRKDEAFFAAGKHTEIERFHLLELDDQLSSGLASIGNSGNNGNCVRAAE
jgi:hypothetical protein